MARRGVSIALACRTFGVSETCYRYSPRLSDENERIGDLLVGLTHVHKTWVRIPADPSPRFRRKPAGDSDGIQPLIPTHSSHP